MAKFRIEIQITILTIIIAAAVIGSGYLVYKSLSQIVDSIHQAARPDNNLAEIKDIAVDLSGIENNVRLFILTNEVKNIEPYKSLQKLVSENLKNLADKTVPNKKEKSLIEEIISLSYQKLEIWEGILKLHESASGLDPGFSEFYSRLEEQKIDTVQVEHKKSWLGRVFSKTKVNIDTTFVERGLGKDEIKQQIQSLESEIIQKGQQINILESLLIENNLKVDEKLNDLIVQFEKIEAERLINKTNEADHLASITYKRLAAFSVTSVILLLLVLSLLYNFVRKTRKYQRMLTKAKTEAEAYAHAKEQFAANVSHEIRTPINAIYGLSEQLLQKTMEESAREQMVILSRSASHLKNIVNDTLDFSKIQANKLKFDSIHFSPSEVFKEIIGIQRSEARAKGLELRFETQGTLAYVLLGDPLRLKQILLNLINNSLKFTDSGFILLQAGTIDENEQRITLKVKVEDSGIGISKEDLSIIFDEYVQVGQSATKKYSGTGLGLSIVKKLVELQGGNISIESEKGAGTKIFIEIPYKVGNPEMIPAHEPINLKIPGSFKNLSVLVADDEEFNRFLLKGIFEKWGVSYTEVTNGIDSVEISLKNNFDIILMDLNMPGKNGLEAAKEILSIKPDSKIVAITASNNKTDQDACLKAGMVGFLAKPFSEEELYNILNATPDLNFDIEFEIGKDTILNEKPGIDFDELRRLANYDDAFFYEMLDLFVRSSETGIVEIEKAFELKNMQVVADLAHKMAAPAKHIKAIKLVALLGNLEKKAKGGISENGLLLLIADIGKEILSINFYIRGYLNNRQTDSVYE
jgi:signal transduction histidine kinase/CheY-like chemotaxis protein